MENTVLGSILDVFSSIGTWFSSFVPRFTSMFWEPAVTSASGDVLDPGGLTFLGVLAVAGLAISVVLLVVSLIQNFLHFRG